MLSVNTIEFGGQKAALNSYSDYPELVPYMNEQREAFAALFPNAVVKTERMTDADTVALCALTHEWAKARPGERWDWVVGKASNAAIDAHRGEG